MIDALGPAFARADSSAGSKYSSGDLAQLRRLDPRPRRGYASTGDAFWRIVVRELEPRGLLEEASSGRALRNWMAILQGLATLRELHRKGQRLGAALATAKISEARLTRLLNARGDALLDQVRPLAHQLRSKAQPVDWTEVAWLLLTDGRRGADRVRQGIASSYYRYQRPESSSLQA